MYAQKPIREMTDEEFNEYNAEKAKRYRDKHPDRVKETLARYAATEKGKLNRWSCSAAARLRKDTTRRGDGRERAAPGGDVTPRDLRDLWKKQRGLCALTGRKMIIRAGRQYLDSVSVDRIRPGGPYVKGNIRLVIYQANAAKLFGSDQRLRDFCRWVLQHRG